MVVTRLGRCHGRKLGDAVWEGGVSRRVIEPAGTSGGSATPEKRYRYHRASSAAFGGRSADRDRLGGRAPDAGRGAESGGRCLRRRACRWPSARWATAGLRTRARSRAQDPDRDRRSGGSAAKGPRSRRGRRRWRDRVHLRHSAKVGAAVAQPRCAASGPVPATHLDGDVQGEAPERHRVRLPNATGSSEWAEPRGPAWAGRPEPVAGRALAPDRRMGSGRRALAAPRSPPPADTPASGRMASVCRRGWSRRPSACR